MFVFTNISLYANLCVFDNLDNGSQLSPGQYLASKLQNVFWHSVIISHYPGSIIIHYMTIIMTNVKRHAILSFVF